jgi:hypothetical protein
VVSLYIFVKPGCPLTALSADFVARLSSIARRAGGVSVRFSRLVLLFPAIGRRVVGKTRSSFVQEALPLYTQPEALFAASTKHAFDKKRYSFARHLRTLGLDLVVHVFGGCFDEHFLQLDNVQL